MPGRITVLGLPTWRAESSRSAAAGRPSTAVTAGVDPAAAADIGMAVRVPAFVVVTLALGLGAHLTAGGGLPTPGSALLVGVLLAIAGRLFALREQSLPRLITMVWSVQAGVHFILMTGHAHGGGQLPALRLGGHHLHVAAQVPLGTPPTGGLATTTATAVSGGVAPAIGGTSSLLMIALHAAAGLFLAAWLRCGEAAAFHAARRIFPRLLRHRSAPPVRPARLPSLTSWFTLPGLHTQVLRLASPRRGPPLLAA